MKDELTIKQRKWLRVYLETGNATEAAMQAYDCKDRDSAANIGYENVRKLDFSDLLEESGITDKFLMEVLKEGLKAVNERRSTPDFPTRHKFLETALRIKKNLFKLM